MTILETKVISDQPQFYHGWPTIARRKSGELLVVCSGGREGHICPFGRVEWMRSHDDGKTWGLPNVVLDTEIDDRDAGALETARGTLLVTTFTSLAYEPILAKRTGGAQLPRWQATHNRLNATQRKSLLGCWMLRSTNGGLTWSSPYDSIVNSPHGPIQLSEGRLLYAGKKLWSDGEQAGVCESSDDGQTWRWLADMPTRPGDSVSQYHELHAVETADHRIIAQIRNHNTRSDGETLQAESSDGGKTWSTPRSIGVWGLPSHLLKLKDGRLVMTYGHRRPPFGNQARLSEDHGRTWSAPLTISGDGMGGDLGYPSTVELADGSLLSVWYEVIKGNPKAVLRQSHWTLR
jgi:Neuraminidase (sialidase)